MKQIKQGMVWSRHSFGAVTGVKSDRVIVQNEYGKTWEVGLDLFNDEFSSIGDETSFETTEKLPQTDLSAKFIEMARTAIIVCFNKKLDEKELVAKVMEAFGPKATGLHNTLAQAQAEVKKVLTDDLSGAERVMRGYHYGGTDTFGRVHFTEVACDPLGAQVNWKPTKEGEYDKRHRLVDPRTIKWFIVGDTKYGVKK